MPPPPTRLLLLTALLAAPLALTACGAPAAGPQLLSQAEIALAVQGAADPPDSAALLARAAGLSTRAAQLRRASIDQDARRRAQERAARLVAP